MALKEIAFTDLILHTLFDQFEFSAHSFVGIEGPYSLDGIGIDFQSPFSFKEVLKEAKDNNIKKIYLAHTHPLSNDVSLSFVNAAIDPREEVAFGLKALPMGSQPSEGDIEFFSKIKHKFLAYDINIIGLVFSASGLWEFDSTPELNIKDFKKVYSVAYPMVEATGFLDNWTAKIDFPNYYMELEKPKMHQGVYKAQLPTVDHLVTSIAPNRDKQISGILKFYKSNGVNLVFHPYKKFGINPIKEMRHTLDAWTEKFANH